MNIPPSTNTGLSSHSGWPHWIPARVLMGHIVMLGSLVGLLVQSAAAQSDVPGTFEAAFSRANQVRLEGNDEEALRLARKAHEIAISLQGEDSLYAADSHQLLGVILKHADRFEEALGHFEKSQANYSRGLGARHDKTAFAWMKLGEVREDLGNHAEALKNYETARSIYRELEPADSLKIARVDSLVGDVFFAKHESAAAIAKYRAAFDSYAKSPNEGLNAATQLRKLGLVYQLDRDYQRAVEHFGACIEIRAKLLGPGHSETGVALADLGMALSGAREYADARQCEEQALAIHKATLGPRHPNTVRVMANLARTLGELGELQAARKLFEEAISIQATFHGADAADAASVLNNYANLLTDLDELDRALEQFELAAAMEQKQRGPMHPKAIIPLIGIANVYALKKEWAKAERQFNEILEMYRQIRAEKHADVADVLTNIAISQSSQDHLEAALNSHARALEIRREVLGEDHQLTARSHMNLAIELERNGEAGEAFDHADQCRRSMRRYVTRILPGLSDREQLSFLEYQDQPDFHNGLILAYAHRDDPAVTARSAEWVVNGKALASEALAAKALLLRDSRDPTTRQLAKQLEEIRRQLAARGVQSALGGDARQLAELEQLSATEQNLARQLAQLAGTPVPSDWIALDAVRQQISPGSMLVDIVRYRFFDVQQKAAAKRRWLTDHYVAWIVPPAGDTPVRIVDLGEAEPIDKLVHATRMAIESPADIRKVGESEAEQKLLEQMAELSQHTLRVLARELPADTKRLLLSPDSQLWLLPWAALPLADGRYAIEQYEFQYVVSARDLFPKPAAGKTSNAAIIADPDFELSPRDSLAATEAVLRRRFQSEDLLAMRAVHADTGLPKVERLPGTATEAEAILPKLQAFTGTTPVVYKDRYALEGVFKALIRPRALVLATHGFFLESEPADAVDQPRSALAVSQPKPPVASPLLRCGLILAGFNSHEKEAIGDDGVLTGLEIVGCDLRGTELVVLSACQTGLGQVNNGDGVSGLRQAFQLAGAQSVVATLWQIPDRDTALLMNDFFTKLAEGESKSQALRSAQVDRIADRRKNGGAAHPLFWAAFTVTGE